MSLTVVGSVAYDAVETPEAKIDRALGGSAVYFAAAASLLIPVNLVGVVGEDFDRSEIEFLRARGVDLSGLTSEKGRTFFWKGRYLADMNERETLDTQLNVFESFDPVLPESYRTSPYLFLANIHPQLQLNVIRQSRGTRFVAMDTMNYWINGTLPQLRETLAAVDGLLINDSEARLLSGENSLFRGIEKIQKMGPRIVIVKKGEHGAILKHEGELFICPAYPVEQLFDPTGAGDTFAGGFMGYLARAGGINRASVRRAMLYGTALASLCVETFSVERLRGADLADVEQRVERLSRMMALD